MKHYIVAREEALTIGNANNKYEHNERINKSYLNKDIDLSKENHYYKRPDKSYMAIFRSMADSGLFSTRKVSLSNPETAIGSEIIVAVAGDYFQSEEQAIEFFGVANVALNEFFSVTLPDGTKVDGKDLCMSSVVHLDEGSYGLHYTTATCVPRELKKRRTKKEMATGAEAKSAGWYCQLSHSGFWSSEKDGEGNLYYSYSRLNDVVADAYRKAGYTDIVRGEKGSKAKHLHPNAFKALMRDAQEKAEQGMPPIGARKVAGHYIVDEKAYNDLTSAQRGLSVQYQGILMAQKAIDEQQQAIAKERQRIKRRELEADKSVRDSADLAEQCTESAKENKKKEKELQNKSREIIRQKEIISIWEELFRWLIDTIQSILNCVNAIVNGNLSNDEQAKMRQQAESMYADMIEEIEMINNTIESGYEK